MAADTYKNNAVGFLFLAIDATATSCTLNTGQGALFPAAPFVAQIDQEVVLVTNVSADTLMITRGYEIQNNPITLSSQLFNQMAHTAGAPVSQGITAGLMNHLWRNIPDRYNAQVPPLHRGLVASTYDDEFEWASGLWSLTHSDTNYTSTVANPKSYLHFTSTSSSGSYSYTLTPFTPTTTAWTASARLLTAGRLQAGNTWTSQLQVTTTSGNIFAIGFTYGTYAPPVTGLQPIEMTRADETVAGVHTYQVIPKKSTHEIVAIRYDGYALSLLCGQENAFTVLSKTYQPGLLGSALSFVINAGSPTNAPFHTYVDWFRETTP